MVNQNWQSLTKNNTITLVKRQDKIHVHIKNTSYLLFNKEQEKGFKTAV